MIPTIHWTYLKPEVINTLPEQRYVFSNLLHGQRQRDAGIFAYW
jgi:hypothetical protein